jgi:hypothetical protein
MKEILQALLILFVVGVASLALAGRQNKSAPAPTPDPLVILAQGITDIAEKATDADRQIAHATPTPEPTPVPSYEVQMGRAWGYPAALALIGCGGVAVLGVVLVLGIFAWDRRTAVLAAGCAPGRPESDGAS